MERAKGFEPSTPTLARLCSTPEKFSRPSETPIKLSVLDNSNESYDTLFGLIFNVF